MLRSRAFRVMLRPDGWEDRQEGRHFRRTRTLNSFTWSHYA